MIYVIHGKDRFRSRHKLTKFRGQAESKGVEVLEFDFADESEVQRQLRLLEQSFSSQGLFAAKQAIIIRNILGVAPQQLKFFENLFAKRTASHVIMFSESQKIPASHRFYKKILKREGVVAEEYAPFTKKQLMSYVKKRFYEEGRTIRDGDVHQFLQLVGDDLFAIEMSVVKICLIHPDETFVGSSHFQCLDIESDQPVFALSKYLFQKDVSNYVSLLTQLEKQGNEPLQVLGFLKSQVRKALIIKEAAATNQSAQAVVGGSPYAIKMLSKDIHTVSLSDLKHYLDEVSRIDVEVKFEGKNVWNELLSFGTNNT